MSEPRGRNAASDTAGHRGERLGHRALVATGSVAALASSWLVAHQEPVPTWEIELTQWINSAPSAVAVPLYPIMQLGSLLGPGVVAVGVWYWTRDRRHTIATAVAGVTAWFGAKLVKSIVERDRPLSYISDINVREGDGTGFGFISGHSAVAATTAVMAAAVVPRRYRAIPALLAGLVGLSRIVFGVHLPADVIGGWAFGTLIGLAALSIEESTDPAEVG